MRYLKLCLFIQIILLSAANYAQKAELFPKLKTDKYEYNENLTKGYSGFGQINWRSIGAGFNIQPLIFIRNFNTDKNYKNPHKNLDLDYVYAQGDKIKLTKHEYETYLGGYIFDLKTNLYPFVTAGINSERKVWEIRNTNALPDEEKIYTIFGKYKTQPTGACGIIYVPSSWCLVEANVQIYPVLPYVGFGVIIPSVFSWFIVDE